jgi:3D (Asp-Asp-Asp) domain-containing protein
MVYRKKAWWEKIKWGLLTLSVTQALTFYLVTDTRMYLNRLAEIKQEASVQESMMRVTAYIPTKNKVATLKKEVVGLHAAVSRDKIDLLGKRVYIMCGETPVGIREVTDLMSKTQTNSLDIMVPDEKTAKSFGEQSCKVIPLN